MGQLVRNGVHLQDHEFETIKVLLQEDVEINLIPPIQGKGIKTPDFTINSVIWEMKAPEGSGKKTMQNTIQRAGKQSPNVIIDLRRSKMSQERAINELKHHFQLSKRLNKLKIITKEAEILDFLK